MRSITLKQIEVVLRAGQVVALAAIAAALCWVAVEIEGVRTAIDYIDDVDTESIAAELDRANDREEREDRARLAESLSDPLGFMR